MPVGEVITGASYNIAVWKNREYTCPGCLHVFLTVLGGIAFEGQMWGLKEVVKSGIVKPPPGFSGKN
jgi:hypothetical protein